MISSGGGLGICSMICLMLLTTCCLTQEILHVSENTTVFLDQSVVFTCETDGGLAGWKINDTLRANLPPEILRDLSVTSTGTANGTIVGELTIPARVEYNGTRVQCVELAFGSSSAESETVTLKIQGPLSAVDDLRASSDASSVTIWWTAPFSLDVTGVDPDIWYSVLIYNVTDEDNPTAILCTDCTNITETHYTFTPDYLSPGHVYTFFVTPFNGAGQGETSHNTTGFIQQPTTNDVQTTGTSTPPPRPPSTVVTPSTPSEENNGRRSLPAAAATAGVGIPVVIGLAVASGVLLLIICRMRRRKRTPAVVM